MSLNTNIKKGALLIALSSGIAACDSLQITGGPIAIGAAQAGNLLTSGGFDGGFGAWRACSDPAAVTLDSNDINTEGKAELSAGGCLFQTVPAKANDEMVVSCNALRTDNAWTSLSFGYLDADYQPLGSVETPVTSSLLTEVSASMRAPTNTAFAEVLIYTENGAVVDDCELINLSEGLPQEFLVNGFFEEGLNSWQSCEHGSTAAENNTATITQSCIRQKFTAYEGVQLSVTCDGVKLDEDYAALALGFLDADNQPLEVRETPLSTEANTFPTVTLTGPADTNFAQVMIYTVGEVSLDSCSMNIIESNDDL